MKLAKRKQLSYETLPFEVMPFGLMNFQAIFQSMMDRILLSVDNLRSYVDNIVIFSKSSEEGALHLETVFQILKALRLKIKECSFMKSSVELLSLIVDKNGVHIDEQKKEKVRDAIPPTTRKGLQSFLVLASYFRRFIPGFAKKAKPLNEKTSENVKFTWSEKMQAVFEETKMN